MNSRESTERLAAARPVCDFITAHWDETIREIREDSGTLLGLPHPFAVPCRKGMFQELYYWDTYFTCVGLMRSGRTDLAIDNVRNLASLVDRFGFIPNGSRSYYLNRSQPPLLASMVCLCLDPLRDRGWLQGILESVKREHSFWTERRTVEGGLARYWHHASREELREFYFEIRHRVGEGEAGIAEPEDRGAHLLAEAESGWDFTPRFEGRCGDFCPPDLNAALYVSERLLARYGTDAERPMWSDRAERRRCLVDALLWSEMHGCHADYDFMRGKHALTPCAAGFFPLWAGMIDAPRAASAAERLLAGLEADWGIVPCRVTRHQGSLQWNSPNLWPCLQYVAIQGLWRYGLREDALRLAAKYVDVVSRCFYKTGDLWEKYNAETGTIDTANEKNYQLPAMMGWTAGTFLDAVALLEAPERYQGLMLP